MKHRDTNIPPLLFILLLVGIGATQLSNWRSQSIPISDADFADKFCRNLDWRKLPPARRQLCGVGIFLNSDTAEALMFLPAIGPKRAHDIVSHRKKHGPFKCIEDLEKIRGIGPATVQKLAPWIEDVHTGASGSSNPAID